MKYSFKRTKKLVGIIVLILLIVFLNFYQKEVKSFFYSFSAPIQKVLFRAGESTNDFLKGVFQANCLNKKVKQSELKNQELLAQLAVSEELKKENEILRKALNLELQNDFQLSLVQIIGKDVSRDFILIDQGSEDGISKEMPVITEEKVLVGKISEVYDNFSKVMLISNKEISFDAETLSQKEPGSFCSGIIKGQGNFKVLFDLIPKEAAVFQGDVVLTSALGGIFPKGFLVGEIKEVKKNDLEPFQQAEIEPFFNLSRAEILFVVLEF